MLTGYVIWIGSAPRASYTQVITDLDSLGWRVHHVYQCVFLVFEGDELNEVCGAHADVYINDAFSTAHRAHASTEAIPRLLPSAAGFLMESELNALNAALNTPQRPVVAIVGGSKISTKLSVLNNIVKKVDGTQELQIALAGFNKDDIEVAVEKSVLSVSVSNSVDESHTEYVHRGIAQRTFARNWELSEDTKVTDVIYIDGLLRVTLMQEIPEEQKRKVLTIS